MTKPVALWFPGLLVLAGCEIERSRPVEPTCVTWESEVQEALSLSCSTCHSGRTPAAGYDVSTYHRAIETATAGVASSALLTTHPMDIEPLLRRWVVECRLALRNSLIHDPGIQNPADPEFHGRQVDFPFCATCHGEDFLGGGAKSSCLTCHQEGPTDCSTCHGDGIDAEHRAHPFDCSTCHVVPERWDDPGHLDEPPAEVTVDCGNVWCHGNANPRWEAGQGQADCGTCHGLPPEDPNHLVDVCERCHLQVDVHINGTVELGITDEGCQGCHGTPEHPAPNDRPHRRHLNAQPIFGNPIACETCHLVPTDVVSPGHLDSDSPAEVFPPEILAATLAGPDAVWNTDTRTCNEYCHGGSPSWDSGASILCDSCHGIPPADANHEPTWPVSDCARCHPVYQEEHIDGHIDVRSR